LTPLDHGVSATTNIESVPDLCRHEAWRFASVWGDLAIIGATAALAWVIASNRFVSSALAESLGVITTTAVGACVGASLPLLARLCGAWRFARRLRREHDGKPTTGVRVRFLASVLQQAGISALRCSPEDLRRSMTAAASAAAHAARSAAMPATVAAFIAPAVALIGGLDMARRTSQATPIAAMGPSMAAGIAGGLVVMILVAALTAVIRAGVERWGAEVDLVQVAHLAGRPISRVTPPAAVDDQGIDCDTARSPNTVAVEDYEQTLRNLTQSS
jgi:hypothetical protein